MDTGLVPDAAAAIAPHTVVTWEPHVALAMAMIGLALLTALVLLGLINEPRR